MDDQHKVIEVDKVPNQDLLNMIWLRHREIDVLVIEMIASMGMAVGAEVFETCVMIGKVECMADMREIPRHRILRREEKLTICGDSKAKDANIRRALIERFAKHDLKNGKGTKRNPDHFYGFRADMWAAFAVGTTWLDKRRDAQSRSTRK